MTEITTDSWAVTQLATDVFAHAAFGSLFWRPRYLIDSPVVSHLPLLFWVCATLRPSNAAVVGAGDGVAHFALCQAIDRFNGQGRCSGYGFWKEAASGGMASTTPPKLTSHQGMLYEEISHLVPSQDLDAVADELGEGTLDLLWLDLTASLGGLGQRADLFSRSLNRTGVMFIHGIREISDEGADSAALERLIKSERCVRFDDEKGLLLVAFDNDLPTSVEGLLTTAESAALAPEVERVFRRLGQGLASSVRAADAVVARKNAEKKADELSAALDSAERSIQAINSAYELKNIKFSETQSEFFDTRIAVSDLRTEIAAKDGARLALEANHEKALAEIEHSKTALQRDLDAERSKRSSETATLTHMAKNLREKVATLKSKNVEHIANLDAAEALIRQTEEKSKTEVLAERHIRFKETATLTRMIEDLKSEREKKKRQFESWMVKKLVWNQQKKRKYFCNRYAFFADSQSIIVRTYFRMRPGA